MPFFDGRPLKRGHVSENGVGNVSEKHALKWGNVSEKSHLSSQDLVMNKGASLDDYLYFFPNDFTWDRSDSKNDILQIGQGDYSSIYEAQFEDEVEIAENGDFVYASARGQDSESGRYGFWFAPNDFEKLVYVWVLPESLEIVDARCNRDWEWVTRKNPLAWFGSNVNNVSFNIRYRAKTAGTFQVATSTFCSRFAKEVP